MPPASELASNAEKFECPNCHVLSKQRWTHILLQLSGLNPLVAQGYAIGRCDSCEMLTFWFRDELLYPNTNVVAICNSDAAGAVKTDFDEAVAVFDASPRSSCALLRLAVQRICIELGLPGKNLNEDIGALVTKGLPEQIRQSLDVVRVIGNNQVHPGVLDVRDDPTVALTLFDLVNLVIEYTVSNPRRIRELHDRLPQGAKDQIARRDGKRAN